jgi:predicted O-methyltransferase YrrM
MARATLVSGYGQGSARCVDESERMRLIQKAGAIVQQLLWRASNADRCVEAAVSMAAGQITLAEARFLGDLVRDLTFAGPIVEVGTLFGWSTRVMALFKSPERELITVDNFAWNPCGLSEEAHHRAAASALAECCRDFGVRMIREDKAVFFAQWGGPPPALVFLDAIHSYEETAGDILWARRARAGLVCVHDYAKGFPGVIRAVDEAGGAARLVGSLAVLPLAPTQER